MNFLTKQQWWLVVSVLMAVAGWIISSELNDWAQLTDIQAVAGLVLIVGGVVRGYLTDRLNPPPN